MKTHTSGFKNNIKTLGRELKSVISYEVEGESYQLGNETLNSITPHYEGAILKSVMKQLDIDSNVEIPVGTELNYQFGIKVNNSYEMLEFGNYIVYSVEKQEDTRSYRIVAYDKMLYSMKPYEQMSVTYPITIHDYIVAICDHLGLTFKNEGETFVNYSKQIEKEMYIDEDDNVLEYTFRDVLDQLAEVTASTICINENDDELEVRYINNTNDTIDEQFLKDKNVNFGEKTEPINTIVLARSAGSDKISLSKPVDLADEYKNAIEISENQIMNFNNRDIFMQEILDQLYGLEFYVNDYVSTGICYYDLCDRYNVQVGNKTYSCIMLNDEINITQGLVENVYCDKLEGSDTNYSKVDKTDRTINQTTLIVDKQGRTIEGLVTDMYSEDGVVNGNYTQVMQTINEVSTSVQSAGGTNLLLNSVMFAHDENGVQNWDITGLGTIDLADSTASVLAGGISGHVFILNDKKATQRIRVKLDDDTIPEDEKTYYTFSTKISKEINGTCYVKIYNSNEEYTINIGQGENPYFSDYEIKGLLPKDNYYIVEFYGSAGSNATFTDNIFTVGKYKKQWTQANGEIMNTQVNIGINGVSVKSATNEGTETNITPFEFAGYAMVGGVRTKVFTLNGDTTEVEKVKSKKEINMPPLKIIPITSGTKQGWAFVPTGGDN